MDNLLYKAHVNQKQELFQICLKNSMCFVQIVIEDLELKKMVGLY